MSAAETVLAWMSPRSCSSACLVRVRVRVRGRVRVKVRVRVRVSCSSACVICLRSSSMKSVGS